MSGLLKVLLKLRTAQWILVAVGLLTGGTALLIGVSDNPPGLILLYLALISLAAAWVWTWRSPRDFWLLLLVCLGVFPVSVILHNLFYYLVISWHGSQVLLRFLEFLGVFFFLVGVMAVGPTALVALAGGIATSWRGMTRLTLVNRSFRRFKENHRVTEKQLWRLVNLVRQSASGANRQPLKFILSWTPDKNELIFTTLSWAAYLKEWAGPVEGERPAAYLVLLGDTEISKNFDLDAGIASQSITLGAAEMGLGGCLIGSIRKQALREALKIPDRYEIILVIALGRPAERVVLADLKPDGDVRYWRDEREVHYVPKRMPEELILDL